MARHDSPRKPAARSALAVLAIAGAALGAGAATAAADAARTATDTLGHVTGPAADLKPNALAGTGVDPLDNGVGTQVADFKPVESRAVTGPVAQAPSIGSLPVARQVTQRPSR
ncbi:hypothetical protein [Streptomyces djakartensis]|uniref:ATP-binding protein n=1 Tax=Streptomyces djakartensis TaxID=68193 RepID=A0ABQ2Z4B9_9ACTN|nr:hypothetical protein [Streptomyces djakartensis]GGY02091.1 hypothetical protein GCM10010384_02430 [Streptomyces djakartensis]